MPIHECQRVGYARTATLGGEKKRPRGGSTESLQYLEIGLFPVHSPSVTEARSRRKVPSSLWSELAERHKSKSLRQLAKEYGVSHEAIRQAIARAKGSAADKELPGRQPP